MTSSRKMILARRQAQRLQKRKSRLAAALGGIGLLMIAAAAIWVITQNRQQAFSALAGKINSDQPLLAVHEMGESPAIVFLPAGGPQPEISINERFYDFGVIGAKDVVRHSFLVANTGMAPLNISRAYTTCGCTTAEISSSLIPPGEAAEVTIILDAGYHDASGQTVRRGLILENNDPKRSKIEIWIQATVR